MFIIGDLVRIKPDRPKQKIGLSEDMKQYVGKNARVTNAYEECGVMRYIDGGENVWLSCMLESANGMRFGVSDPKVERFGEIAKEMTDLYARKNHDYGDSFSEMFNEYGMTSVLIRISDKYRRLKTLSKGDALVNESIRDTLMDLANYAVMTIIELENIYGKG